MTDSTAVTKVNSVAVSDRNVYVPMNLSEKISPDDPETKNIISDIFGNFKNFKSLRYMFNCTGLDPNVNYAYQQNMTDPNQQLVYKGRTFYSYSGVGFTIPNNPETGTSKNGCWTMHAIC